MEIMTQQARCPCYTRSMGTLRKSSGFVFHVHCVEFHSCFHAHETGEAEYIKTGTYIRSVLGHRLGCDRRHTDTGVVIFVLTLTAELGRSREEGPVGNLEPGATNRQTWLLVDLFWLGHVRMRRACRSASSWVRLGLSHTYR